MNTAQKTLILFLCPLVFALAFAATWAVLSVA